MSGSPLLLRKSSFFTTGIEIYFSSSLSHGFPSKVGECSSCWTTFGDTSWSRNGTYEPIDRGMLFRGQEVQERCRVGCEIFLFFLTEGNA